MSNPKVTVLMPVYNGEKYLLDSIKSILNQTYRNFEFLIIDDGSTDCTSSIIKEFHDPRIRYVRNERNLKLIATLNKGITLARGEYIARMDCDDISLPKRLEKQVSYLESNPNVMVVGTGMKIIGSKFKRILPIRGTENIKYKLAVNNCISHPTVMIRKKVFDLENKHYDEKYLHAEDYELWQRLSLKYSLENLGECLLLYRLSPEGISRKYENEQLAISSEISQQAMYNYGVYFEKKEYEKKTLSKLEIQEAKKKINIIKKDIKGAKEGKVLSFLWLDICNRGTSHGVWTIKTFFSLKELSLNVTFREISKLFLKCFIKRKII